jgi:hypothetical protein
VTLPNSFARALLVSLLALIPELMWGKVMLRWTQGEVPPAMELGVRDLVISCDGDHGEFIRTAVSQGYRLYVECSPEKAGTAATAAAKAGASGIVVDPGDEEMAAVERSVNQLRAEHAKFPFVIVNQRAVQPQMKGTLVISRDGVLQVTSPTAQPWVDTNLALVKIEQAVHPGERPLYTFNWHAPGPGRRQGPEVSDYQLAVAEAGAFGADVILSVDEGLQAGLVKNDEQARATWKEIGTYLRFYPAAAHGLIAEANVGVIANDDQETFEPINLLARHNIGVRVMRPRQATETSLRGMDLMIVLLSPDARMVQGISQFAASGKTVVLVNDKGTSFPWHSANANRNGDASVTYARGKGQIIELTAAIADPETFARDVRRLIDNAKIQMSLWNALTTVGVLYREPQGSGKVVELVNYAADPLEVQVRVKGLFPAIRYESPERGCCVSLAPFMRDGFTEFSVPALGIAGRVHLGEAAAGTEKPKAPGRGGEKPAQHLLPDDQ